MRTTPLARSDAALARRRPLASRGSLIAGAAGQAGSPRFYPDDPLWHDPETQDAAGVQPIDLSDRYDLVENSFLGAGERISRHAANVNTLDEVPDSTWFTNRLGRRAMTTAEVVKGPDTGTGPAAGHVDDRGGQDRGRAARPDRARRDRHSLLREVRPARRTRRWPAARRSSPRSSCTPPATTCPRTTSPPCVREALVIGETAQVTEDGRKRAMRRVGRRRRCSRSRRATPTAATACWRARRSSGNAGGAVPLLRHAAGRPQRHLPARASPRAARPERPGRVAEPRRLARDQHARHARPRRRHAPSSGIT